METITLTRAVELHVEHKLLNQRLDPLEQQALEQINTTLGEAGYQTSYTDEELYASRNFLHRELLDEYRPDMVVDWVVKETEVYYDEDGNRWEQSF